MENLFNAIALEIGFATMNARRLGRFDWLHAEQCEVLENSCLGANLRVMTSGLFCKAYIVKLAAHFRSQSAAVGYVVVYADSNIKIGASFAVVKADYVSRGAAERQAVKFGARCGSPCKVMTRTDYIGAARGVIRQNMMNRTPDGWYVEGMGTPGYCSPSSEAYWSM